MRVHLQAEYYRVSALFEVIQLWAFSITRKSSRRDVDGLVAEDVAPGDRPGKRPAIPDARARVEAFTLSASPRLNVVTAQW